MSACPTGCGRDVAKGFTMCRECWRLVPPHLQRDVLTSARAFRRASSMAWGSRLRTLARELATAKRAAIEHVKAKIIQKELAL